ncbi:MAG: hypothetical protein ACLQUY_13040 [Ktedonobacterales bacterium]
MRIAIRLCGASAVVAYGVYVAIMLGVPSPAPATACFGTLDCGVTTAYLIALLFLFLGGSFAALAGLLVVIAALRTRERVLGVGLALVIFTILVPATLFVATDAFLEVLYYEPGAYFPGNTDQLLWYVEAAPFTYFVMIVLAPLPALFLTPGRPGPRARPSASLGEPGPRPPISPRLALSSVLLAGVSLVVLDRVIEHYAVAGVGPAWPALASVVSFCVFWWVAWLLLMGSWLLGRSASVS